MPAISSDSGWEACKSQWQRSSRLVTAKRDPEPLRVERPLIFAHRSLRGTGSSNPPLSATQSGMLPYIMEKR